MAVPPVGTFYPGWGGGLPPGAVLIDVPPMQVLDMLPSRGKAFQHLDPSIWSTRLAYVTDSYGYAWAYFQLAHTGPAAIFAPYTIQGRLYLGRPERGQRRGGPLSVPYRRRT
jgi:hypothetical protein